MKLLSAKASSNFKIYTNYSCNYSLILQISINYNYKLTPFYSYSILKGCPWVWPGPKNSIEIARLILYTLRFLVFRDTDQKSSFWPVQTAILLSFWKILAISHRYHADARVLSIPGEWGHSPHTLGMLRCRASSWYRWEIAKTF